MGLRGRGMNSPPGGPKKGSGLWGKNGRETNAYKRSGRWILEKQFPSSPNYSKDTV